MNDKTPTPLEGSINIKVVIKGHLDNWLQNHFEGLKINHELEGNSVLSGNLPDLAAFYGLILKLRDSGVDLLSLEASKLTEEDR